MAEENQGQTQQENGQRAAQNAQQGQQQEDGLSARPSHGMTPPTIDYDKLADIINGRTAAAESAALNGYFREQGLTKEEPAQAIAAFNLKPNK